MSPIERRFGGLRQKGRVFGIGGQLAAWRGLVPRQHSSGGKPQLLGISKRGDTYLLLALAPSAATP